MSDRLSQRWKGSTEGEVIKAIGTYKIKTAQSDGYFILFDYSYLLGGPTKNSGDMQFKVSNQPGSFIPRQNNAAPVDSRSPEDSVIRRMQFYFDGSHRVQSVTAIGYPDSVYYIRRK
jgi:hypothetical protein